MTTTAPARRRRLSVGVEPIGEGAAHARVWAPACRSVQFVAIDGEAALGAPQPLTRTADGFFDGLVERAAPGTRYWYRLDGERLRPDPVSRFQPEGPHGPSQIVDPDGFGWTDQQWTGPSPGGQVIYEMHVGTFTREGTWRAAAEQLDELASLGVTTIEMMPVADFCGRWGWGYDGVNLYAPTRLYGSPDDLRTFVDRAHRAGLAVILDVVYNHFGPDGNYMAEFSADYFTAKYENDWGEAINFEGPEPVRRFFIENAVYWIGEFHLDGLRLDATQDIHDASPEHVIAALAREARAAAGTRRVYLVAENEPQQAHLARETGRGGFGLDAVWNDDYHHAAVVALTGRRDAYFTDYRGTGQELISCLKYGYLFQGQWYAWQKKRRGTPSLDLPHRVFVHYLENHDQVANTGFGRRLHELASPGEYRAMTALTLLGPATPLLFQGQEFSSSAPFVYFVDHNPDLQESIQAGRLEFLSQFSTLNDREASARLPSPVSQEAFFACKLDFSERERHADAYALHRDLLAMRREDPVLASSGTGRIDGAVLGPGAFALRYFGERDDRLLVVNLDRDLQLAPAPEPLMAPPLGRRWMVQWHSESPRYGGSGLPEIAPETEWRIPGHAAVLFATEPCEPGGTGGTP